WAALVAVHAHNVAADRKIETVAFPAMGTGFGGVPFDEAARQMAAAYRHYLNPPHRLDWDVVAESQKAICYDGGRRVVSEPRAAPPDCARRSGRWLGSEGGARRVRRQETRTARASTSSVWASTLLRSSRGARSPSHAGHCNARSLRGEPSGRLSATT